MLFTRLLTDDGGRLLDTTELGRHASARLAEAITIRAGTCRFPTCTVPADRCDLDHHEPRPRWRHVRTETWIRSAADTTAAKPSHGSPASETTTASTGPCPTPNTTDASTNHYPPEWPPEGSDLARAE